MRKKEFGIRNSEFSPALPAPGGRSSDIETFTNKHVMREGHDSHLTHDRLIFLVMDTKILTSSSAAASGIFRSPFVSISEASNNRNQ